VILRAAELRIAGQPGGGLQPTRKLVDERGVGRRRQRDVKPATGAVGVDRDDAGVVEADLASLP
jgi:hypothetical protein